MFPTYHALAGTGPKDRLLILGGSVVYVCSGISNIVLEEIDVSASIAVGLHCYGMTVANGDLIVSASNAVSTVTYVFDGLSNSLSSSFAMPATLGRGITFDGTDLWWARTRKEVTEDSVIVHMVGISGSYYSFFLSPRFFPCGLSNDGTNLLSTDSAHPYIYRHDGYTLPRLSEFILGGGASHASVTSDGTNLVTCHQSDETINIHDGFTSTIVKTFSAPSAAVRDMEYIPAP